MTKQKPKKNKSVIANTYFGDSRYCPNCKSDLRGDKIPEKHRKYFGNATHFRRSVAISSQDRDKTVQEMCPDCRHIIWDLDKVDL